MASDDAPAFRPLIGAAGLIGVDMLENRRILIDFRKGKHVSITETRKRARPLIRDDDARDRRYRPAAMAKKGRLILSRCAARLAESGSIVIVDTGAQTSCRQSGTAGNGRRQNCSNAFSPPRAACGQVRAGAVPATPTAIEVHDRCPARASGHRLAGQSFLPTAERPSALAVCWSERFYLSHRRQSACCRLDSRSH